MMNKGKKKKDILFLLQYFYPQYITSATLPYDVAKACADSGHTVDVICGYPKFYCNESETVSKKEKIHGININRLKYIQPDKRSKIGRIINFFSFTMSVLMNLPKMKNYKSLIVFSDPPVLPIVASVASKLFGNKLIFVTYDIYPEVAVNLGSISENCTISRFMRCINNFVYKQADAVIALSNEMKDFIVKNRPVDKNEVHVIHNWYQDLFRGFEKNKDNKFSSVVGNRLVVSYLGNMGLAQDIDTMLDSMIKLKDDENVCFLIAGHGCKSDYLKSEIENNGIENAYVYDFLLNNDYLDALRISDCAVLSLEENLTGLGVPSKTYSYMMQGLFIFAIIGDSDISADMKRGAGMQIQNGDSDSIVENIKKLYSNPQILQSARAKCREIYLNHYTTEISVSKYVELIDSLIN